MKLNKQFRFWFLYKLAFILVILLANLLIMNLLPEPFIGEALAAETWDIRWRFDLAKAVFDRVSFAQIKRVRITSVAVLTADAFLPVNVSGQIFRFDEQVFRVLLPNGFFPVARHA